MKVINKPNSDKALVFSKSTEILARQSHLRAGLIDGRTAVQLGYWHLHS